MLCKGVVSFTPDLSFDVGPDSVITGSVEAFERQMCGQLNQPLQSFKLADRYSCIQDQPVSVRITSFQRYDSSRFYHPLVYKIECHHANFHWTIYRQLTHFLLLHKSLRITRAKTLLAMAAGTRNSSHLEALRNAPIPRFPRMRNNPSEEEHMKNLEEYLNSILTHSIFLSLKSLLFFMEISQWSFICELGPKFSEALVAKRTGSDIHYKVAHHQILFFNVQKMGIRIVGRWFDRWLILKETCIAYACPEDGSIRSVMLMDKHWSVSRGKSNTLAICNGSRNLVVKFQTKRSAAEWYDALQLACHNYGKVYVERNRFGSFAPVRGTDCCVTWYVDGSGYFSAVADAIDAARSQIFITDWWLSPDIFLKRPVFNVETDDRWRLDQLLLRKAKSGVKIFILVYKEIPLTLNINSLYTKEKLMVHENVKLIRHPNHEDIGVVLWTHHEKLVVIDQLCAFVGGIDLCFGRWDDHFHRLRDLGDETKRNSTELDGPGTVSKTITSSTPAASETPHSLAVLAMGANMATMGAVRVIENITNHNLGSSPAETSAVSETPPRPDDSEPVLNEIDTNKHKRVGTKLWPGKDYANFVVKDFVADDPFTDNVDRFVVPRMPWHDIASCVVGPAAKDVARHFVQRWNAAKIEKHRYDTDFECLLPNSLNDTNNDHLSHMARGGCRVKCQIVRSVSQWSASLTDTEDSIHQAYISLIDSAKHFVYIENQFFVSLCTENADVKNEICQALARRIIHAHSEDRKFRVIFVLPLLPGFEGRVGSPGGEAMLAVAHWIYVSLCRGETSLMARLRESGISEPDEYISIHGLRTHSVLSGEPVSEQIYVHSKLMIVDDVAAIVGSANVNDRSMLGCRDSEVCMVVEDLEFVDGRMNGVPVKVGKSVSALRKRIFREFLGMDVEGPDTVDLDDPVSDTFFKHTWQRISSDNTALYDKVFRCVPTDKVRTLDELRSYQAEIPISVSLPQHAMDSAKSIQGFLVDYPCHFLCDANLLPSLTSLAGLAPTTVWT